MYNLSPATRQGIGTMRFTLLPSEQLDLILRGRGASHLRRCREKVRIEVAVNKDDALTGTETYQ